MDTLSRRLDGMMNRRSLLAGMAACGLSAALPAPAGAASPILMRPIPKSGETIPAIGMGTWITFNVGEDETLRKQRSEVLRRFFALGGGMIDSSPMYGSAEAVVGGGLARLGAPDTLFSATKVWTWRGSAGEEQMANSRRLWGLPSFDLMQIHNLVGWENHLETLLRDKAEGRVRYIGVTTSHGRRHEELEEIMASQPIDFVQFTYNVVDREAEQRLLPLAAERRLAVIVNRPFRRGALFSPVEGRPLPSWAAEIDCANWAQVFLKFIVSHPAVTCAIPATSQVVHMEENMGAMTGRLPDEALRQRMARDLEAV